MDKNKKDLFMLELAEKFKDFSKDPYTQVAAIACDDNYRVLSMGYNGFPSKFPDEYDRISRDDKNLITIHAEVNCILNAAKNGVSLKGTTVYVSEHPCSNCAAALVNSGVKKVICRKITNLSTSRWGHSLDLAAQVLKTCNVELNKL